MSARYLIRRGDDTYDRPKITGSDVTYLSWLTPVSVENDWTSNGSTWQVTTTGRIMWATPVQTGHDLVARVDGPGTFDLIFRYQDADNYWIARWDPALGSTAVWSIKAGTAFRVVESRRIFRQCAALRVGLEGPVIVLYGPDGARVASFTDGAFQQSTRAGVQRIGAQSTPLQLRTLSIATRIAEGYVWPGDWSTGVLDVQLGAAGVWDSTDINNPNVVRDPGTGLWEMNYTGYRNDTPGDNIGDGIQDAGRATATSLDGPWAKRSVSAPVFSDDSAGRWSQNGGFVRRPDGTWLLCYSGAGGGQAWFATAASPAGPFTAQTWGRFTASDPFLRYRQDGTTLECYYYRGTPFQFDTWRIYRRTSTDGGQTWGGETRILDPAPVHYLQGGEPSVLVPPGTEGRVLMVAVDYLPDGTREGGRGTILGATRDAGQTWAWHLMSRGTRTPGWEAGAAFDSFMVHDTDRRRLYYYYGGVPGTDNQSLGIGIQIGHRWCSWDPTGM